MIGIYLVNQDPATYVPLWEESSQSSGETTLLKLCKSTVKEDLLILVQHILHSRKLLKAWYYALIYGIHAFTSQEEHSRIQESSCGQVPRQMQFHNRHA